MAPKKRGLSLLLAIVLAAILASGGTRPAAAADTPAASEDVDADWPAPGELSDQIVQRQSSVDTVQTLTIASLLVMLTQAGFALLQIGLSRSKNIGRTFARYLLIYPLAGMAFWVYGFALRLGNWYNGAVPPSWYATLGPGMSVLDCGLGIREDPAQPNVFKYGLLGTKGFCLHEVTDPSVATLFLIMMPLSITAASIPIGAMAERWRWKGFLLYGLWVALPFSVYANWVWGGGWLAQAGVNWSMGHGAVDIEGSGVVFGIGGIIALVGCSVLGPRVGSRADDKLQTLPDYNLPAVVIGTAILLLVWLSIRQGFEITPLTVNAMLSTVAGAVGATLLLKLRGAPANTGMICMGLLAGAVAISGPCAFVDGVGAAIIGSVAGMLCVLSVFFWRRMGVDDAVGAISVFGASGIWGFLAIGLFANGRFGERWNGVVRPSFVDTYGSDRVRGWFYGDPMQFAAQILAAGVLIVFGAVMAFAWFQLIKWAVPPRLDKPVV